MDATAFPPNFPFIVAASELLRLADAFPIKVRDMQTCHVVLTTEVAR